MKNLITRSVTGILYLVVFIGALLLGKYTFGSLFLIITLLCLFEFYRMIKLMGYSPQVYPGIITGGILFSLAFLYRSFNLPVTVLSAAIPFLIFIIVFELYRKHKNPVANIAFTFMGNIYIVIPLALFNYFAFYEGNSYSYRIILGFFTLLWINDIYCTKN